jgi:hypothetical protein
MGDLVAKLRTLAGRNEWDMGRVAIFDESADRIEALERENAELRDALKPFASVARFFEHLSDDGGSVMVNLSLADFRRARRLAEQE